MKKSYLWGIIIVRKQLYRTFKLFYMGGSNMKKFRNILALLMVVVMLVAVMPMNVFAEPEIVPNTPGAEQPANGEPKQNPDPAEDPLKDTKKTALEDLEKLTDLTPEQKAAFEKTIKEATEQTVINNAVTEARAKNEEEKAKKDAANKEYDITKTVEKCTVAVSVGDATVTKAKKGATVKLTITPEANCELKELKVMKGTDEVALTSASDTEKTFVMPEAAVEVIAKYKEKKADDKKPEEKKPEDKPVTPTPARTINVVTIGNGTASVDNENAINRQLVTVTAKPYSGYVVDSIVVRDGLGKKLTLFNEKYKNYYYDDYPYYLRSRWYRGYDYDDYIRWCDRYDYSRYDYSSFKRWCNWNGYSYDYDDFRHFYDWDDIYDYGWYNRYDYSYLNQADFVMPNSAVTVEVTFTSASYWYDDYYYYRYYRNKKDNYYERQKKAEEKAKEEEEAKAKAEAAKQPQIYENKAVISIGSNVLDKVSKNVHTVHQMDAPAYVNGGRVMLPLRYVAEALGLQVSWVPETKTVIIWDLTQRVEIPVKSNRIIVNGITYTSDVKPEIKNERTMLPIANIARALGLIDGSDIVWDQYNKQVTLTRKVLSK